MIFLGIVSSVFDMNDKEKYRECIKNEGKEQF